MTYELKPCPFCGGDAVLKHYPLHPTRSEATNYFVACTKCDCQTHKFYMAPEKAVERWNNRAGEE